MSQIKTPWKQSGSILVNPLEVALPHKDIAEVSTTMATTKDQPVDIKQASTAGARMCFFSDYLYMAYENGGNCWISRSPDGWHWQDTRQLSQSGMDTGTVPAIVNANGVLVVAYANNGTFVISGTVDGWRWIIDQVVTGNNFTTKGGITMAINDEVYILWVEDSTWKVWMIHSIGGIGNAMQWTAPTMLTYQAANMVGCIPTIVNFKNHIYLIYQEYGGIGGTPQPDSSAPTDLYSAQYDGTKWTYGPRLPIDGNPGHPCLTTVSSGNELVLVYTKRDTDYLYAKNSADGVNWGQEMTLVKGRNPGISIWGLGPDPFMVFNDSTSELWMTTITTEPTGS